MSIIWAHTDDIGCTGLINILVLLSSQFCRSDFLVPSTLLRRAVVQSPCWSSAMGSMRSLSRSSSAPSVEPPQVHTIYSMIAVSTVWLATVSKYSMFNVYTSNHQVQLSPISGTASGTHHLQYGYCVQIQYHNLPSKRPWALEIHRPKKRGWAFTRRSHLYV